MLKLLPKLTNVKRNIFNYQQKVYIWFYIFKSICPKGTAVPKVSSLPYCYKIDSFVDFLLLIIVVAFRECKVNALIIGHLRYWMAIFPEISLFGVNNKLKQ